MPMRLSRFSPLAAASERLPAALARHGADGDEDAAICLLLSTIERFGAGSIDSARIEREHGASREVLDQAAELGLFGLTIPPEYGGSGLSLKGACRVIEALACFDSSFSTTLGLHNGLGVRGLVRYGSDSLKERYLHDLAAGRLIAAFSATEAGAGSHISDVRTEARYDAGERCFRLNGAKVFVTNGALAGLYTVLVSTPEFEGRKKGLSLLLVPRSLPGVSVGKEEWKLGLRGSSTTSLFFDQVKVPPDHVLGVPGAALEQLEDVLAWGRTLMSAGCIGPATLALRKSVRHALVRRQFGQPLARFGLVQEKISLMAQRLYLMESLTRLVGECEALGSDLAFVSSAAKIACSEGACFAADAAIQVHGGSGFIEETGLARLFRDTRITRIFEGTNEMLRLHGAMQILSWSPDELIALGRSAPAPVEGSADETAAFHAALDRFGVFLGELKRGYGFRLIHHQFALRDLADAGISLFSMLAALVRTRGILDSSRAEEERDRASALCLAVITAEAVKIERIIAGADRAACALHEAITKGECRLLRKD